MTDTMKAGESHSIVDDFMYGSNVAAAHVYIRMGKQQCQLCHKISCTHTFIIYKC